MDNAITTQEQIDGAIENKIDPMEIANVIYPRIEQAIELAKTPEEANSLRGKIASLIEYVKSELPRTARERQEKFKITHPGERLYLEAYAKAGALWSVVENKKDKTNDRYASGNLPMLSVLDAGFSGSRDATTGVRIAQVDQQDRELYYEETAQNMKQATASGLEHKWHMFNKTDTPPLPEGKYQVIYADPPWPYATMQHSKEQQATDIDSHYPPMKLQDICDLDIQSVSADNSVLFLWTTSPFLEKSFEVIKAWGFTYKANMVWDKVKHNVGYYFSIRHEHLLLATKGSCLPDNPKLYDSVQTIERSNKHSQKPERFREIIEDLYHGPKLELFSREPKEGWKVWGNEVTTTTV